jgi:hypothetical protein
VSAGLYGPYEQLQPASWPLVNGNEQIGEAYRRCCTSVSWVSEALTMHVLKAESVWNYPAFFDYVDRWMTKDDTQAIAAIKAQTGFDYSANWERQGQTRYWLQGRISAIHIYRRHVGRVPALRNATARWVDQPTPR